MRHKTKNKTSKTSKSYVSSKKQQNKKISVKEAIDKITTAIKKPFQKAKNQKENDQTANLKDDQQQSQIKKKNTGIDVPFAENSTVAQTSKFFYSNDRFIETFDDLKIYDSVVQEYPNLLYTQKNEQLKKQSIIHMLDNDEFMQNILETYNMNILDFFKFLFRLCPSLFKGLFVKKIQKTIKNKKYSKQVKFSTYKFQDNGKRKNRRKKSTTKK